MVNSEKIKQRARELGIRQCDLADALGLQQSSVNLKINNLRPMTLNEAEIIANVLKIDDERFSAYFFA